MTPVLVFDIETVPDVAGIRRLEGWDAEMPDEQVAEQAFTMREAQTGSRFLQHHLQRVVAISCVLRRTLKDGSPSFHVGSLGTSEDGEAVLIQKFFELIEKYTPQLVSWNGGGFDLPVLHYRSLIHGVSAARYWEMGDGGEYDSRDFKWNNYISRYHMRHLDLMDVLALYQPRANAPLDALAKLCGFPGKLGMDGSQVWEAYLAGQIASIRHYCETDVVNTYLMYCRFQQLRGKLGEADFVEELQLVRKTLEQESASHWQAYLAELTLPS